MPRKKLILLTGLLIASIIVVLVLISLSSKEPVEEPHPDRVDVSLTNTDGLENILLGQQYHSVINVLADYIQATINPEDKLVAVQGSPKIARNGNISFTLQIKKPDKQLSVELDRTTYFDKIILKIPQDNYETSIPVYTSQ